MINIITLGIKVSKKPTTRKRTNAPTHRRCGKDSTQRIGKYPFAQVMFLLRSNARLCICIEVEYSPLLNCHGRTLYASIEG